jgi:hypothetical protein
MARRRRRKCKCCRRLFRIDPSNRRHQRYCSAPRCRRASKAASQARWLAPAGQTATTSATPGTPPASVPGGRVIPATGAGCSATGNCVTRCPNGTTH